MLLLLRFFSEAFMATTRTEEKNVNGRIQLSSGSDIGGYSYNLREDGSINFHLDLNEVPVIFLLMVE